MTRAPYVLAKVDTAFGRAQTLADTTIDWRFINPSLEALYGAETIPRTGENVAKDFGISRADQDAFALRGQQRAATAHANGFFAEEIVSVTVPARKKGEIIEVSEDEHPRADTTIETLGRPKPLFGPVGTVTAGNASGINDRSAAMIVTSEDAVRIQGLTPRARVLGYGISRCRTESDGDRTGIGNP